MTKKKKGLLRRLSNFDDIRDNFKITKEIINNEKKKNKKEYIKETFEDALNRLNISKEDEADHLRKVYRGQKLTSLTSFFTSIIVFIITTVRIFSEVDHGYFIYIFYLVGLALLLKSFECAFRSYQIRVRKLGGLKEFALMPKEWYPKKYIHKKES